MAHHQRQQHKPRPYEAVQRELGRRHSDIDAVARGDETDSPEQGSARTTQHTDDGGGPLRRAGTPAEEIQYLASVTRRRAYPDTRFAKSVLAVHAPPRHLP